MTMTLRIHVPGAEPYTDLEDVDELVEAIKEEARTASFDAGSDLLDDPGQEARDGFAREIVKEATAALVHAGDQYRDPAGVLWSLE